MFNNPYMPNAYNPQTTIDKLNEQINNLERMKAQMQQPVQQPVDQPSVYVEEPQKMEGAVISDVNSADFD